MKMPDACELMPTRLPGPAGHTFRAEGVGPSPALLGDTVVMGTAAGGAVST